MAFTTTIRHNVTPASGNPVSDANDYSAAQVTDIEETVPASGNIVINNFDVDVSEAEVVIIECDQNITLTINDDGTPDATVNVLADKPVIWKNDGYFLNPLGTVDVTSMKAANAGSTDATLRIHVLQDPTP